MKQTTPKEKHRSGGLKVIKTTYNGQQVEIIYSPAMDKLRDKLYDLLTPPEPHTEEGR